MEQHRKSRISGRRQPQQARSTGLVEAVLDAALQVLAAEGAHRFTTARVAERAGVSVGSLYQYFPNKAAILFRLQSDEWRRTAELLRGIVQNRTTLPLDRLDALVHAFVRSECEEAAVRATLADAAPLYRDTPEAREARVAGTAIMREFMRELLPRTADGERALATDLIEATLAQVGKRFSEQPRSPDEIDAYAGAMAEMFRAYLARVRGRET